MSKIKTPTLYCNWILKIYLRHKCSSLIILFVVYDALFIVIINLKVESSKNSINNRDSQVKLYFDSIKIIW